MCVGGGPQRSTHTPTYHDTQFYSAQRGKVRQFRNALRPPPLPGRRDCSRPRKQTRPHEQSPHPLRRALGCSDPLRVWADVRLQRCSEAACGLRCPASLTRAPAFAVRPRCGQCATSRPLRGCVVFRSPAGQRRGSPRRLAGARAAPTACPRRASARPVSPPQRAPCGRCTT